MPEQPPNQNYPKWEYLKTSLVERDINKIFSSSNVKIYVDECFQSNPSVWNDAFSFNFENYIPEAVEWAKDVINFAITLSQALSIFNKQFKLHSKNYESEIASIVSLKNVNSDQIKFLRDKSWARLVAKKYVYLKLHSILNDFSNISKI